VRRERRVNYKFSEAIYLRDPDGNGIELYCDSPRDEWPRVGVSCE